MALPFHWMPDVLRVYAITLERAEDDAQRSAYTVKAREFIAQMAQEGYFDKEPDALQRLRQDSELNQLLSHELIDAFLRTLPSPSSSHDL